MFAAASGTPIVRDRDKPSREDAMDELARTMAKSAGKVLEKVADIKARVAG